MNRIEFLECNQSEDRKFLHFFVHTFVHDWNSLVIWNGHSFVLYAHDFFVTVFFSL